jgi:hypothetical protein
MPIYSLGDICSHATTMAGGRLDWIFSEASFWCNQAYAEVATRINAHRPKEALALSSTTSGQNRMALPPDFDYSIAVTLYIPSGSTQTSFSTQVQPLRMRDSRFMDSQAVNGDPATNTVGGIPEVYMVYSNWLELWPSPNSAYSMQMRYMSKAPVLVQSTDTPVLDERWHTAILYKTVELLEASRDNREGEAYARNRYLQYVASTPTDYALRQKDRTGMVLRYMRRYE